MNREHLDPLVDTARQTAIKLLEMEPIAVSVIPLSQGRSTASPIPHGGGVYLIWHRTDGVLYVGRASHLEKRIRGHHVTEGTTKSVKDFRRLLASRYNIEIGPPLRRWMEEYCTVAWVEIKSQHMIDLVERLVICWMREEKQPLLNREKVGPRSRYQIQ